MPLFSFTCTHLSTSRLRGFAESLVISKHMRVEGDVEGTGRGTACSCGTIVHQPCANTSITLFGSPAKRRGATRGLPRRSPILVLPYDSIGLPEPVPLPFFPSTVSRPPDNVVRSLHSRLRIRATFFPSTTSKPQRDGRKLPRLGARNPCHFLHCLAPSSLFLPFTVS